METIENLEDVWGDPTIYNGIKIYPIRMKDSVEFYKNIDCLLINKNQIKDVNVLRMSYLDFLFATRFQTSEFWDKLTIILKLVLNQQVFEFGFDEKDKEVLIYIYDNQESVGVTTPVKITGFDFSKIRKIILNQNLIEFDDKLLNPEFQQKLNKAKELMNRRRGQCATIKEQIIAYHCAIGLKYEEIKNLTIYQFFKGIERQTYIIQANITGIAMSTGMVSVSKPIYWIDHIKESGMYDDVLMDEKDFNKVASQVTDK